MESDTGDFFMFCVTLHAELTDTDPIIDPSAGALYGPELSSLEDGQGGPRGESVSPAEEAVA
eukprot:6006368-Pyramimonas_sp.AAC.1